MKNIGDFNAILKNSTMKYFTKVIIEKKIKKTLRKNSYENIRVLKTE